MYLIFLFFSYSLTTRKAASVLLSCSFVVKGKNHVVIVYVICYATRMPLIISTEGVQFSKTLHG